MAEVKKGRVWVVFEGRTPGVYFSWQDCKVQVDGFKGNLHKSFDSIDQGEAEFTKYCVKKGRGEAYVRSHLPRRDGEGTSSQQPGDQPSDRLSKCITLHNTTTHVTCLVVFTLTGSFNCVRPDPFTFGRGHCFG